MGYSRQVKRTHFQIGDDANVQRQLTVKAIHTFKVYYRIRGSCAVRVHIYPNMVSAAVLRENLRVLRPDLIILTVKKMLNKKFVKPKHPVLVRRERKAIIVAANRVKNEELERQLLVKSFVDNSVKVLSEEFTALEVANV